ncbi:MAG: hypothetical protein MUC40_04515, partial [Akkermansiaceae bacterium]|nr:hypothetical protein [Akkermansiaceae bacterium]
GDRTAQRTGAAGDDRMSRLGLHRRGTMNRKTRRGQALAVMDEKNPRAVREQVRGNCGELPEGLTRMGFIRMAAGFLPKLFLPWNARHDHGERAFRPLVHTMKKKILWVQK